MNILERNRRSASVRFATANGWKSCKSFSPDELASRSRFYEHDGSYFGIGCDITIVENAEYYRIASRAGAGNSHRPAAVVGPVAI
jgi:hypothetical protein